MNAGPDELMGRSARAWLWLLCRLWPADFRRQFGVEWARLVGHEWQEVSRRGSLYRKLVFWWRVLADVLATAYRTRFTDGAIRTAPWRSPEVGRRRLARSRALEPMGDRPRPVPPSGRPKARHVAGTVVADVRFTVRSWRRQPGFAALLAATLALGIGANTAIFSFVDGVLLRPLPFADPDRLAMVWLQYESADTVITRQRFPFSTARLEEWGPLIAGERQGLPFERLEAYRGFDVDVVGDGQPERIRAAAVTPGLFGMLGVEPRLGRVLSAADEDEDAAAAVVIGHGMWLRRFGGDPAVLGGQLRIDDSLHTIVGVMPPGFAYPDGSEIWQPARLALAIERARRSPGSRSSSWRVLARVRGGSSASAAALASSAILGGVETSTTEQGGRWSTWVEPLQELIVGDAGDNLLLSFGAVGLLLLIACANVAGLLLSRGHERRREVAIRAALGAGRGRIVRQLATEALLLAIAAGLAGLLLAVWGVELIRAAVPEGLPRVDEVGVDLRVAGFALAVSSLAGLVFGVAPAVRGGRLRLGEAMRGADGPTTASLPSRRVGDVLVVGELAMAVVLLAAAGLLLNSFVRLVNVESGFDPDGLTVAELELPVYRYPGAVSRVEFVDQLVGRLRRVPAISAAAITTNHPFSGRDMVAGVQLENRDIPDGEPEMFGAGGVYYRVDYQAITPGYLAVVGGRLLEGRALRPEDDRPRADVAIINRRMAERAWPGESAVGKRFRVASSLPWLSVVGVVEDIHTAGLDRRPNPQVYVPYANYPEFSDARLSVLVRVGATADRSGVAGAIREALGSIDPELPVVRMSAMTDLMASTAGERRFYMLLLVSFAGAALLLAALGVYGVMAQAVTRRVPEIGVRMALGATAADVRAMVLGRGMILAAIGVAIGLAGALGSTRLVSSLLYEVSARDPSTLSVAVGVLIAASALASWVPARAATRVDPVQALRGH